MLRDFKFLRRNSAKNEEAENVPVNPKDFPPFRIPEDSSRPPLNSIQEPVTQNPKEQEVLARGKVDKTPSKAKGKASDHTALPIRTPDKHGAKNRFGWAQKNESGATTSDDLGNFSAQVSSRVGNGGFATITPRTTRTVARAPVPSFSECNSTQSTPSKSVSKPPSSNIRSKVDGATLARPGNFTALYKGLPMASGSSAVVNSVEVPHFDLKEDPSFWMEHNVQVVIRVRPLNAMERSTSGYNRCLKQESAQTITWIGHPDSRFTFDHVACETVDQEMLFRMACLPMVENCLSGYNSCMFAYGQTGSGKTYTMLGEIDNLEIKPSPHRGMTPRIFEFLFARIQAEEESRRDEQLKYNCKCSFLEIYNEQITDLLDPSSTNLLIREDNKKGVYVENLSEFEVRTVSDILHLLTQGSANRKVAATNMNRESSRSHSVFTCVIESRWEKDSTTNLRFARLNLVDLAGSERQKTSGAEGERLKEAANINKSLSTLGHVIMVLVDVAQGKPRHIPYRDSRLTFLLQDSLGGNSKTMIIANVSPSTISAAETLNTLKFAQRAKMIQNNAVVNEDSTGDVYALQHQIRLLKEELSILKRQNVSRTLSFGVADDMRQAPENSFNEQVCDMDIEDDDDLKTESKGSVRMSTKQLKCLETTLAGALRREQIAEASIKQLEAEIEQLNRLVRQREEDTRSSKMMLRFREDKIQRMESVLSGSIPVESYLVEENKALSDEIQLLQAKLDRNPEVTRFALENIRLLNEIRRFQEFYEEGEREILLSEVSNLRDQLLQFLDGNSEHNNNNNNPKCKKDLEEFTCIDSKNNPLHLELENTISELEDCRRNLNSCLDENAKLSRELEDMRSMFINMESSSVHQDGLKVPTKAQIGEIESKHESAMAENEEIVNLQLELDIIKIILKEERSSGVKMEETVTSLNRDLDLVKEELSFVNKQYDDTKMELEEAKSVIEALESQQILAINEVEDLRKSKNHKMQLLSKQELKIKSLEEQLALRLLKDISSANSSENDASVLKEKVKRMQCSLDKAKRLNSWYQHDREDQVSNDEEMDEVRRQAEAETAEVIVCLEEELGVLQREVQESHLKEVEMKNDLMLLETELKEAREKLDCLTNDNQILSGKLDEKDCELRTLSEEWSLLTSEIEEVLSDGCELLTDASSQLEHISSSFPQKRIWISEHVGRMARTISEKELLIEELRRCLEDANNTRSDVESMLKSLKGAALAITEAHQQECSQKEKVICQLRSQLISKTSTMEKFENRVKQLESEIVKASNCATVAFVIVNRLAEVNDSYSDALYQRNVKLYESEESNTGKDIVISEQAAVIVEAEKEMESLRAELAAAREMCAALREKLSDEQERACAVEEKLQDVEEKCISAAKEKLENRLKQLESEIVKASDCATVAFVIVNRLAELKDSYSDALYQRNVKLYESEESNTGKDIVISEQAAVIVEAEKEMECLRAELAATKEMCADLREKLSDEQERACAIEEKLQDVEEKCISVAKEKLAELKTGVSSLISCMSTVAEQYRNPERISPQEDCTTIDQDDEERIAAETQHDDEIDSRLVGDSRTDMSKSSLDVGKRVCLDACNPKTLKSRKEKHDRDRTILLLRREIEFALQSLKDVQVEMEKLRNENKEMSSSEQRTRESLKFLTSEILNLQATMNNFECQSKIKMDAANHKLEEFEQIIVEVSSRSSSLKEVLEKEVDGAKLVAVQSTAEAACILSKFEEAQDTIKEADIMINGLLIENERMKLEVKKLKKTNRTLINDNGVLADKVQSLQSISDQKNQQCEQIESELVETKALVMELEGLTSELQTAFNESFIVLASDFHAIKAQLFDSSKLVRTWLEDIWSEIIVKDCAVSVLHLCHMGILLETVTGLNAENGLLQHGLCESNAVMADLRERNNKSIKELEICRVIKGKLLADIKSSFDRISKKEEENQEFSIKLTAFDKKISDLKIQEESMLERSNYIGSQLSVLIKELDISNKKWATTLQDQEKIYESQVEFFIVKWCMKEFESLILASELEEMSLHKACTEREHSTCIEVLENLKKELVLFKVDDELQREFSVEKEVEVSRQLSDLNEHNQNLQKDVDLLKHRSLELKSKLERQETELTRVISLEKENETLNIENDNLKTENALVLRNLQVRNSEVESSLSRGNIFEKQNHLLRDEISALETRIVSLQMVLESKTSELRKIQESQYAITEELCQKSHELQTYGSGVSALKEENLLLREELNSLKRSIEECFNSMDDKLLHALSKEAGFVNADKMLQEIHEALNRKAQKFADELECLQCQAENLESENSSLQAELVRKDEVLQGLLFDLSLLQESASNTKDQKDEIEEITASLEALEDELSAKSSELEQALAKKESLQMEFHEKAKTILALESIISEEKQENEELRSRLEEALASKRYIEEELEETKKVKDSLEAELLGMGEAVDGLNSSIEELRTDVDEVETERDELQSELTSLKDKLKAEQARADESDAVAKEAQQMAELRNLYAEEKEAEVKLLERSVEELERTINVLEDKVDIVKGEAERQRLQREELELELHEVKQQFQNVKNSDSEMRSYLEQNEKNLREAYKKIQVLETDLNEKDTEIIQFKAHISELNLVAEAQANEYKQKFKVLEAMAENVRPESHFSHALNSSSPKKSEKFTSRPRGSGSPFKCIGIGLAQQIKSERDEELAAARLRIEELEALAASRQKEIFALNTKLANSDSMTHDVIRDLLGVKLNMTAYMSFLDNPEEVQKIVEKAQLRNLESHENENDVVKLRKQLAEFIEERQGWLEEIERKQAEVVAAQIALEKLRQHDQLLKAENDMLNMENVNQKKRLAELQGEIKQLSGHQNLHQRIHHHAKIKEENNVLKIQNEELSTKLRRTDAVVTRVKDELACFRASIGRNPRIDFDEERRLSTKLKQTEEEKVQLAQKLLGLCTSVLKAAGITKPVTEISPSVAEEALEQIKNTVSSMDRQLQDLTYKNKITNERMRLLELMPQTSPINSRGDENRHTPRRVSQASYFSPLDR